MQIKFKELIMKPKHSKSKIISGYISIILFGYIGANIVNYLFGKSFYYEWFLISMLVWIWPYGYEIYQMEIDGTVKDE